jgi:hypothetical protein
MECPLIGDAQLEHFATGASASTKNLKITSTGNLLFTTDNITSTASNLGVISSTAGYTGSPALTLTNTNATAGNTTGVPSVEVYKSGRNVVVNDVISSVLYYAKNYLGAKTLFSKIETLITNSSVGGGDDGALDFYTCVNGVISLVMRLNGADNENNMFRPLDMNGNNIRTSSTNLTIDATASSGNGDITITPKRTISLTAGTTGNITGLTNNGNISMTANGLAGGTEGIISITADRSVSLASAQGGSDGSILLDTNGIGDIYFIGANLETPTAGGNSGQHLRIRLNGTYYKIALLND